MFYLCHVCEEKVPETAATAHLHSAQHIFSYFAYTDPERLNFSWISMDTVIWLQPAAERESSCTGSRVLQILHLPDKLFKELSKHPYSKVLQVVSGELKANLNDSAPERRGIQQYVSDPDRTHPLVGLDFLLQYECRDTGHGRRGFLCLLCSRKLSSSHALAHTLSFEHLYWYLNVAHPESVENKCNYTSYNKLFGIKMLCLANQAQSLRPSGTVKVIPLDLQLFTEVHASSYRDALNRLESVWKEQNQCDLKPALTPKEKLVALTLPAATTSDPPNEPCVSIETKPSNSCKESTVDKKDDASSCGICCLTCGSLFSFIKHYKTHLWKKWHTKNYTKQWGPGEFVAQVGDIVLYTMLKSKTRQEPLIGLNLVTVCVTRNYSAPPLYLCHACQIICDSAVVPAHFHSSNHYFNVLAHYQPDALPFAWLLSKGKYIPDLRVFAAKEEKKQTRQQLQVCDISGELYEELTGLSYEEAKKKLSSVELKGCYNVDKWQTLQGYLKASNRKYPLLGLQYLVCFYTDGAPVRSAFLCVMCRIKVPESSAVSHTLSFRHVTRYLNKTHCGSIDSVTMKKGVVLMALARQAESLDTSGQPQEIKLNQSDFCEVDHQDYYGAFHLLQKRTQKNLLPRFVPGGKLVFDQVKHQIPVPPKSESQPISQSAAVSTSVMNTSTNLSGRKVQEAEPDEAPKTDTSNTDIIPPERSEVTTPSATASPATPAPATSSPSYSRTTQPIQQVSVQTTSEPKMKPHPDDKNFSIDFAPPTYGQSGRSHLSTFIRLWRHSEPVIGLGCVVECRCVSRPTLFLCLTCEEMVTSKNIISHMTSQRHQYLCIISQYPVQLEVWQRRTSQLLTDAELQDLARRLARLEEGWLDAQVLKLERDLYEYVGRARFSEALNFLQRICKDQYQESPSESGTGQQQLAASSAGVKRSASPHDAEAKRQKV
ncbi:uncharacterized protein LOC114796474 isoform X2 [Denticeps clupeoides]|nr:uncharacterized protein LOC114796474 isoform X2 [Denticeps clupeoides]